MMLFNIFIFNLPTLPTFLEKSETKQKKESKHTSVSIKNVFLCLFCAKVLNAHLKSSFGISICFVLFCTAIIAQRKLR